MSVKIANDTANGSVTLKAPDVAGDFTVTTPAFSTELAPRMVLMTAQNSTSGTYIDFSGIPSWAKKITVMFNGVSTNGESVPMIQLGTSSSVESSGYLGAAWTDGGASVNHSIGFLIAASHAATTIFHGQMNLCLLGSNVWTETSRNALSNNVILLSSAGSKTLSGTLDRIRITTVNGTDTFDAGTVNILVEG